MDAPTALCVSLVASDLSKRDFFFSKQYRSLHLLCRHLSIKIIMINNLQTLYFVLDNYLGIIFWPKFKIVDLLDLFR